MAIRVLVDSGTPTVVAEPESAAAKTYEQLAHTLVAQLDGTTQSMPSISIDED